MDKIDAKRLQRVQSWAEEASRLLSESACNDDSAQVVTALDSILENASRDVRRVLRDPDKHREMVRELLSVLRHVTTHLHLRSSSLLTVGDFPYWDYMTALLSYLLDVKLGGRLNSPTLELCYHTTRCKHRVWDVIAQSAAIATDSLADRMPAVIDKLVAWCPKSFSDPAQFFRFLAAVVVVMKRCGDGDDSESLKGVVLAVEPQFDFPAWFSDQGFDLSVPASKLKSRKKLIGHLCTSAVTGADLLEMCKALVDPGSMTRRRNQDVAEVDENDEMFAIAERTDVPPTVDTNKEIELALEKTLTQLRVGPGSNADTTDCMINSEIISDSSNPAVDPETFLQTFLNPEYVRDGEEDAGASKKHVRKKRRRSESSPTKKSQDSKMVSESEESESENAMPSPTKSLRLRKSPTRLPSGRNHGVAASSEGRPREQLSSYHSVDGERAITSPEKMRRVPLPSDNSEIAARLRQRKESPTELPPSKARTVSTSSLEQDDTSTKKKHIFTLPERGDPRKQKAQQQATHASDHQGGLPSQSFSATSSAALLAGRIREPLDLSTNADEAEVVSPLKKSRRTRKRSSTLEEAEEMQILTPWFAHGSQQRRSPTKVSFDGSCVASQLEEDKPKEVSLNSSNNRGSAVLSQSRKSPSVTPDKEPGKQREQRGRPARSLSERKSMAEPHSSQVPDTSKSGTVLEQSSLSDAEVTRKQAGSSGRKVRCPAELVASDNKAEDISMQKERKRSSTMSSCSTTCIVSSSEEGDRQVPSKNSGNRRRKTRKSATPRNECEESTVWKRRIFRDLRQEQSPARPACNKICDTSSDEEVSQDIDGTRDDSETRAVSPPKNAHTSKGRQAKKASPRTLRPAESLPQEKSPAKSCATSSASEKDSKPQKSDGDSSSSDDDSGNAEVISVDSSSNDSVDNANNETESFSSSQELQHGNQASAATEKANSPGESGHPKMASEQTEAGDSDSSAAAVSSLQFPQVSTNDSDSSENETVDSERDEPHDRSKVLSFKNAFSVKARSNKESLVMPGASKTGIQKESSDAQKASCSYTPNDEVVSARSTKNKPLEESVNDIVIPDSQECASLSKNASSERGSRSSERMTDPSNLDVIPETQELGMSPIKTMQVTDATKQGLSRSASAEEDVPPSQESNCLEGLTQVPSFTEHDSADGSNSDKDMCARPHKNVSASATLRTPARRRSQSPQPRPRSSRQSAIKARRNLIRTPEREQEDLPESKSGKPRRIMTPSDDSDSDPDFSLEKKSLIGFKPRTANFGSSRAEMSRQSRGGSGDEANASQGSKKPSKLSLSQKRSNQACLNETNDALSHTTTPKIKIERVSAAPKKRFGDLATLTPPQITEQQVTESLPSSTLMCKMAEAKVEGAKYDSEDDFTMAVSANVSHSKAAEKRSRTSICQKPSPAAATQKSAETTTRGLRKDSSTRAAGKQKTEDAGRSSRLLPPFTRLANVSQHSTQPMEAGLSSPSFQSPSSESQLSVGGLIDSLSMDDDNVASQTLRLSGSLEKSCCYCSGRKKETRTSEIGTMTDVSFGEASASQASSGGGHTKRDSARKSDSQKHAKGRRKSACSLTGVATPPQATIVRKAVTSRYNLRMSLSVPRRLKY